MQVQSLKQNKTILQCCFNPSPACLSCDCRPGSSTASPVSSWQVTTMNPAVYIQTPALRPWRRDEDQEFKAIFNYAHWISGLPGWRETVSQKYKMSCKVLLPSPNSFRYSILPPKNGVPYSFRKHVRASKCHKRPKFSAQMLGESSIPHLWT